MICEKCGENIPKGAKKCPKCSAPAAPSKACGGFPDILSIKDILAQEAASAPASTGAVSTSYTSGSGKSGGNSEELIKYTKLNMLLSMIIAGVTVIVLIFAIIFGANCLSAVNSVKAAIGIEGLDKDEIEAKSVSLFEMKEKIYNIESSLNGVPSNKDVSEVDKDTEKDKESAENKDTKKDKESAEDNDTEKGKESAVESMNNELEENTPKISGNDDTKNEESKNQINDKNESQNKDDTKNEDENNSQENKLANAEGNNEGKKTEEASDSTNLSEKGGDTDVGNTDAKEDSQSENETSVSNPLNTGRTEEKGEHWYTLKEPLPINEKNLKLNNEKNLELNEDIEIEDIEIIELDDIQNIRLSITLENDKNTKQGYKIYQNQKKVDGYRATYDPAQNRIEIKYNTDKDEPIEIYVLDIKTELNKNTNQYEITEIKLDKEIPANKSDEHVK